MREFDKKNVCYIFVIITLLLILFILKLDLPIVLGSKISWYIVDLLAIIILIVFSSLFLQSILNNNKWSLKAKNYDRPKGYDVFKANCLVNNRVTINTFYAHLIELLYENKLVLKDNSLIVNIHEKVSNSEKFFLKRIFPVNNDVDIDSIKFSNLKGSDFNGFLEIWYKMVVAEKNIDFNEPIKMYKVVCLCIFTIISCIILMLGPIKYYGLIVVGIILVISFLIVLAYISIPRKKEKYLKDYYEWLGYIKHLKDMFKYNLKGINRDSLLDAINFGIRFDKYMKYSDKGYMLYKRLRK